MLNNREFFSHEVSAMLSLRLLGFALLAAFLLAENHTMAAPTTSDPQAHIVFFTLADPSDANRDALVAACHKHLADHDGVVYFSVGTRAKDLSREVNDKAFDVALHVVFESRAAHDLYQTHPRHLAFIKEAKSLWSGVRVFDSNLAPAASASAAAANQ